MSKIKILSLALSVILSLRVLISLQVSIMSVFMDISCPSIPLVWLCKGEKTTLTTPLKQQK